MSRVQGENHHPLSVVWKNGDTTTIVQVSEVLRLFNPEDPVSLLQEYEGKTLYEILIKAPPRKILRTKVRGVTKRVKNRLLRELHKIWWQQNKINFSHK